MLIKYNKIVHELWHNCSSVYGNNIEHNRQPFGALQLLKSMHNWSIIGRGLVHDQFQ